MYIEGTQWNCKKTRVNVCVCVCVQYQQLLSIVMRRRGDACLDLMLPCYYLVNGLAHFAHNDCYRIVDDCDLSKHTIDDRNSNNNRKWPTNIFGFKPTRSHIVYASYNIGTVHSPPPSSILSSQVNCKKNFSLIQYNWENNFFLFFSEPEKKEKQ